MSVRIWRVGLALVAVGMLEAPVWSEEVARKDILKLNDAQGEELITGRIAALKQDGDKAKQFVAAALPLAKEAKTPLNYTSAYILGTLAREQKDAAAAEQFFKVCLDKAKMLKSDRKVALCYLQLLATQFENQKLDNATKSLDDFLQVKIDTDVVDDVVVDGDEGLVPLIESIAKNTDQANKLVAHAIDMLKDNKVTNYGAVYVLAYLAREVKNVDASRDLFRICLNEADRLLNLKIKDFQARQGGVSQDEEDDLLYTDHKLAILYVDLIDLLYENKRFADAEKICKELLEKRNGNAMAKRHALLRLVQGAASQGRMDDAFKQLAPFLKAAPNDPEVLQINAWLLWQAERYDEAAKVYEKILADADDDDTKERIQYRLSHLYTESGNIAKAAEQLKALLAKKPDNSTYNNDLGYVWADHDQNLDEAQKFIQKALDKDPKSGAYLDSMGWVLYKKGQFKEAKEYLEKALQDPESQHAELYEHMGDIHWKLGEKTEAVSAWKKALDLNGATKRDLKRKADVEKKLKQSQ